MITATLLLALCVLIAVVITHIVITLDQWEVQDDAQRELLLITASMHSILTDFEREVIEPSRRLREELDRIEQHASVHHLHPVHDKPQGFV